MNYFKNIYKIIILAIDIKIFIINIIVIVKIKYINKYINNFYLILT